MSILKNTIILDDKTSSDTWCRVKMCPDGYVPLWVEVKQKSRMNSRYYPSHHFFYHPEHYNYQDIHALTHDWFDKHDPITNYKTKSQKYLREIAILKWWWWGISPDGNELSWGMTIDKETKELCEEYRKEKGVDWNEPLNEPLHLLTNEECRVKFLESGGSFEREESEEVA